MRRWLRTFVVVLVLASMAACGGGTSGEGAFRSWYKRDAAATAEVFGSKSDADVDKAVTEAKHLCGELSNLGDPVDHRLAQQQLEGGLSGRYFVDATTNWICPDQLPGVQQLFRDAAQDWRKTCAVSPSDLLCNRPYVGVDPLS